MIGGLQPICSTPGHSWQGPFFFSQKSAPLVIQRAFLKFLMKKNLPFCNKKRPILFVLALFLFRFVCWLAGIDFLGLCALIVLLCWFAWAPLFWGEGQGRHQPTGCTWSRERGPRPAPPLAATI